MNEPLEPSDFEGMPDDSAGALRWALARGTAKGDQCEAHAAGHLELLSFDQLREIAQAASEYRFDLIDPLFLKCCINVQLSLETARRLKGDLNNLEDKRG
jgi:hypothetical protein